MTIPRLMHQIWIGPHEPPRLWLDTWREQHPRWTYRLWTNIDLHERGWINAPHMKRYYAHRKWAGIADLMRYEILHHFGGIVVAADSICLNPVDDLFQDGYSLYAISTVYPGNSGHSANHGATAPLYASIAGHPFTSFLIGNLRSSRQQLGEPVRSTGNRFMQRMLKAHRPTIKIWPMHYFIPEHFNGWKYTGPDKVYAKHFWGTTRGTYAQGRETK